MKPKVDLSSYNNSWYNPGTGKLKRLLWYFTNVVFFQSYLFPINGLKLFILRRYGAKVGKGCVIKPSVNIKYPWNLSLGDHVWLGERVWIDNLVQVNVGNNVCISQGAFLLCGNHDYKKPTFDLIVKSIDLGDGSWIGAKAIVCPGVKVGEEAVLAVNSVATSNLKEKGVYQGNPALIVNNREIV